MRSRTSSADRLINPHAPRPIGDLKEIEAIREVFGDSAADRGDQVLTAIRSRAGAQEAIYSILMMNNGFICERAPISRLSTAFADMPIVRERRDDVTLGAVRQFGSASRTNASVVLSGLDA